MVALYFTQNLRRVTFVIVGGFGNIRRYTTTLPNIKADDFQVDTLTAANRQRFKGLPRQHGTLRAPDSLVLDRQNVAGTRQSVIPHGPRLC